MISDEAMLQPIETVETTILKKKRTLRDHLINLLGGVLLVAMVYGTVYLPIENHNLERANTANIITIKNLEAENHLLDQKRAKELSLLKEQGLSLAAEATALNAYSNYITGTLDILCRTTAQVCPVAPTATVPLAPTTTTTVPQP